MSRNLTSGWIAAASAASNRPFLLFFGFFPSAPIALWTGAGDLVWNAVTWIGNGFLQNVSGYDETSDMQAQGIQVTVTGVPALQISFALQEMEQNELGEVYLGFLDSSNAVIADPYKVFEGRLDTCQVTEGQDTSTVVLGYESRLIDLERMPACRYTDQCQRSFYPNDGGFRYVHKYTVGAAMYWGKAGTAQVHHSRKKSTRTQGSNSFWG